MCVYIYIYSCMDIIMFTLYNTLTYIITYNMPVSAKCTIIPNAFIWYVPQPHSLNVKHHIYTIYMYLYAHTCIYIYI